jgi:hypothetical protein
MFRLRLQIKLKRMWLCMQIAMNVITDCRVEEGNKMVQKGRREETKWFRREGERGTKWFRWAGERTMVQKGGREEEQNGSGGQERGEQNGSEGRERGEQNASEGQESGEQNGSDNYKQHTRNIKKITIFRTTKCTSTGGTLNFEKGDKSDPWEGE